MRDEAESVRHLVELGYVDPDEVAANEVAQRQQRQSKFQQAVELNRSGRRQEAAAMLESLSTEDPQWSPPHQVLAEIYYGTGRLADALCRLEWLAQHGYDQPRLAMIAGAIALARRNLQSALDDLRYACHAEPSLPSVHTLLGMALFRLGQWDAAEDAFREAAQQNPADAQARDGLAAVFLRQGEYEDAADWALRALEQDMKLFRAHYHLGVALAHLDRPKEAVAALETSARIDPSRAAPFYWLSRVAARQLHDAQRGGQYQKIGRERVRKRRSMNRIK